MQVNVNNQNPRPVNQPQQPTEMQQQNPKASMLPWILLIVVVVVVLAAAAYLFRDKLFGHKNNSNLSGYQAVFLTNDQVYFGKLDHANSDYVHLTDIYYLQVNQQLQPTGTNSNNPAQPAQTDQTKPQLTLVKFGNELHGPADGMQINRSQVLFIEDLRADGAVAKAIANFKNGK